MNDISTREFLIIVDDAIAEANEVIKTAKIRGILWMEKDVDMVKRNFEKIKMKIIAGELPKSEGAGLGITRALSEMGVPDNLYRAGKKLEDFYISNW